MPLVRHPNKVTERAGVNYIQTVVEQANSVFNPIHQENDLGIDCYIDFTIDNYATGFTVCAQIKSGESFKDSLGYKIPASKSHIQRWAESILPVVGFVYDPGTQCAYWVSISDYLHKNLELLNKESHVIRVPADNTFRSDTFASFRNHFKSAIEEYKSYENYGRSLDEFADFTSPYRCYNGLKSLFSNHKSRKATWTYIITCFEHITEPGIQGNILGVLSNFLDNPNVFWSTQNPAYEHYQRSSVRYHVLNTIKEGFSRNAVYKATGFLKDGINQGTFSHLVFLVLNEVNKIEETVYDLAVSHEMPSDDRQHLCWLYAHFAQHHSPEKVVTQIRDFVVKYGDDDGVLIAVADTIEKDGYIQTG